MSTALEATLARHRQITILALAVMTLLAWIWLLAGAGMDMHHGPAAPTMNSPSTQGGTMAAQMAEMPARDGWTMHQFVITFSMWWIMMIAMMLPSAAAAILLYARVASHGATAMRPATGAFLSGYLLAWGGYSLAATLVQLQLAHTTTLLGPMTMASTDHRLSALILLAAGVYQLSPVKAACLQHCRNPATFLSRHYRPGPVGALHMGLIHGTYCVGCCWLLMALLFVGGVMNLAWIALLTAIVAAEKLLPLGRQGASALGIACLLAGGFILLLA